MNKIKKYSPYLLLAVAAVVFFAFGKKIMQMFGIAPSEEQEKLSAASKAAAEAVLNTKVDETILSQPLGFFTSLAQDCYSLTHDFFHTPSFFDSIISRLHTLNAEDLRQLVKSYAAFDTEKTLYKAVKDKFTGGLFGSDTNRVFVAFDEALKRANIAI